MMQGLPIRGHLRALPAVLGFLACLCALPPAAIADVTSYADWRGISFGESEQADESVSGKMADPDGDGIPNLLEYALLRNPHGCIVRSGPTYHLFANDGNRNIAHATSDQPFSGYTPLGAISDAWRATLGGGFVEGPNVVRLGGPRWRMYLQHGGTDVCYYAESSDNMQTWSGITRLGWSGSSENPGHGTVIKLDIPSDQEIAWQHLPPSP